MKKAVSLFIIFILVCAVFCFPVSAAGTGTLGLSGVEGKQGDTVTLNVNLTSNPGLITMKFTVSWEEGLDLVSVSNAGLLAGWTTPSPTVSSPYTLRWADSLAEANNTKTGKIATLTFKIKDNATVGNKSVTLTFIESRDIGGGKNSFSGASATVKVNCKTHSFGAWSQTKVPTCTAKGSESRTCSVCQKVESRDVAATGHSMSGWKTTKEAGCETKGEQTRTCSKCSYKEVKATEALGHKFSKAKVTKEPTCTEAGTEVGTCTVCGKESRGTVKALGHDFGKWSETKAATCTEKGEEERKCARCDKVEKRETEALEHDFEDPEVVKEATIYSTGLMQGKCKRCGETTEQIIPCTYTDEKNGVKFEAEEGVFREGTQITVNPVDETNANYETAKNVLATVASEWIAYDISALRDGAKIQPNGKVKVSFDIPDGYGSDVAVYYIGADGTCEKIDGEISEDGKTVTAELEHFSLYAVCKAGTEDTALAKETADAGFTDETGAKNENGTFKAFLVLAAIFALVLILVAIVVAIWILKRNDRRRYRF